MDTIDWYKQLIKPSWAPPEWLFGPVWSVLYIIIFVSFGAVFYSVLTKEISWLVALPFILNLLFNFAFTPLQFGAKSNFLAAIDILLIVSTLLWAFYSIWNSPVNLQWIVYVNIPYLLWGSYATGLQLTITYLNRKYA